MDQGSQSRLTSKRKGIITLAIFFILATVVGTYYFLFAPPQKSGQVVAFEVPDSANSGTVANNLKEEGFIKNRIGFSFAIITRGGAILSGQYRISRTMTAWKIAHILLSKPALRRVLIPEGLRKEQIANILAERLNWNAEQIQKWVTTYTALKYDYLEGVYFPDTYYIPVTETPLEVAGRLQRTFEEKMKPYIDESRSRDLQWTTVLTMASIIQREAAGPEDGPLIAGILWNRLRDAMPLDVDATIQYARDSLSHYGQVPADYQLPHYRVSGDWWTPVSVSDKTIDSPFNTYLYKGLPPHPIANPGTVAFDAALNPSATDCLYYLHDSSRDIHCAKTLAEHEQNIARYLTTTKEH